MSEEKKEYNTIEEDDMTQNETEEILEEDDVKLAEETVSETEETEETVEEKTAEKKGLFGKNKKDNYRVTSVRSAKSIALVYIKECELDKVTKFGLPEIDDRFDIWRVPILSMDGVKIGEIVIDAISSFIDVNKTTTKDFLENRLLGRKKQSVSKKKNKKTPKISMLSNTIRLGDSEELLMDIM